MLFLAIELVAYRSGNAQPRIQALSTVVVPVVTPAVKCGSLSNERLTKLTTGRIASEKPSLHTVALSPSGRFAVFFDTSGTNAAAHSFVDSVCMAFDMAFAIEITEIGYDAPPPSDTILYAQTKKIVYSVYVLNLGADGIYGATRPLQRIPDVQNTKNSAIGRFTSYIVVDNNYSTTDSTVRGNRRVQSYFTHGIAALRVTAAHEFHHAIQLGSYGNSYTSTPEAGNRLQCALHELTSTWIERRVVPTVRDYEQFIPLLFTDAMLGKHALSDGDCLSGYIYSLFGEYLHAKHGDHILRRMWELSRDGRSLYTALDNALKEQRTFPRSLDEAWQDWTLWLYATGVRFQTAKPTERFENASDLPTAAMWRTELFSPPSASINGSLKPLESRFVRFLAPSGDANKTARSERTEDTIDVCIASQHSTAFPTTTTAFSLMLQKATATSTFRMNTTPYSLGKNASIEQSPISTPEKPPFFTPCFFKVFVNAQPTLFLTPKVIPFPNPFAPENNATVAIALPEVFVAAVPVSLKIWSVQGHKIYESESLPTLFSDRLVYFWDGTMNDGAHVTSGLYTLIAEQQGQRAFGSILVQR